MVECRICGLMFTPEFAEDRELHEERHRRILRGGFPYEIRQILKRAAWEAVNDQEVDTSELGRREHELGKRAMVYGRWARAVANGIPETEFEPFMAAQLAYMDAVAAGDKQAIAEASEAIKPWRQYG